MTKEQRKQAKQQRRRERVKERLERRREALRASRTIDAKERLAARKFERVLMKPVLEKEARERLARKFKGMDMGYNSYSSMAVFDPPGISDSGARELLSAFYQRRPDIKRWVDMQVDATDYASIEARLLAYAREDAARSRYLSPQLDALLDELEVKIPALPKESP